MTLGKAMIPTCWHNGKEHMQVTTLLSESTTHSLCPMRHEPGMFWETPKLSRCAGFNQEAPWLSYYGNHKVDIFPSHTFSNTFNPYICSMAAGAVMSVGFIYRVDSHKSIQHAMRLLCCLASQKENTHFITSVQQFEDIVKRRGKR